MVNQNEGISYGAKLGVTSTNHNIKKRGVASKHSNSGTIES